MPTKQRLNRMDKVRQRDAKPREVEQSLFSYKPKNKKK